MDIYLKLIKQLSKQKPCTTLINQILSYLPCIQDDLYMFQKNHNINMKSLHYFFILFGAFLITQGCERDFDNLINSMLLETEVNGIIVHIYTEQYNQYISFTDPIIIATTTIIIRVNSPVVNPDGVIITDVGKLQTIKFQNVNLEILNDHIGYQGFKLNDEVKIKCKWELKDEQWTLIPESILKINK